MIEVALEGKTILVWFNPILDNPVIWVPFQVNQESGDATGSIGVVSGVVGSLGLLSGIEGF